MKKSKSMTRLFSSLLSFFLTVSFAVTCCMMLFLNVFAEKESFTFTSFNIKDSALITFQNVILISVLYASADFLRRLLTVDRPVKTITKATKKIMKGDFSVRIKPLKAAGSEGLNQIIEAINTMTQELSSIETLKTDFISNVSHELKTPLSIIQNYGTLLQSKEITEEVRIEYAKRICETSQRMADMVTNILKLNKLENQQIFPEPAEYNLSEQLCECLLQYEHIWEGAAIELETDIEEDVKVNAIEELLSLVWCNLFSNAFKFTEPGGLIKISLKTIANKAIVSVQDSGCGIAPDALEHIFDKFYQEDTSHTTQGNGLGLALVKRVMDITKGEISVESIPGEGSTFTVRINKA